MVCNNLYIFTGGSDGKICISNLAYATIQEINVSSIINVLDQEIRCLTCQVGSPDFVFTARSGEIIQVSYTDRRIKKEMHYTARK